MAGLFNKITGFFKISRQHNPHFEAASKSRRMGGFDPAKNISIKPLRNAVIPLLAVQDGFMTMKLFMVLQQRNGSLPR
ncbi:hypothetical protein [Bartonella raoultii]|uniref:hypothetical protein n=1 Tax=Bartonella raoultii TaxID=1457020 RepID=UPI0035A376E1